MVHICKIKYIHVFFQHRNNFAYFGILVACEALEVCPHKVDVSHSQHGLRAPLVVPVKCAAVHQGRVVTATLTECLSSGTGCYDNMEPCFTLCMDVTVIWFKVLKVE